MAEEIGIYMTLYDKVSPVLTSIANSGKAFDKDLEELQRSCEAYEKSQNKMTEDSAELRKALEDTASRVRDARKEYSKFKDDAHKGALDDAIEEQEQLKAKLKDTELAMKDSRKAFGDMLEDIRRADNQQAGGGAAESMLGTLGKAGLTQMAGQALSGLAETMVGSAFGSEVGTVFSSALSGAVSGAALGSLAGPVGTAVGAAIGGGIGLLQGGTQVFEQRDEAFKGYVQGQYEGGIQRGQEGLEGGSSIASQRETDLISFTTLFGGRDTAQEYLKELTIMANTTPFLYGDLTAMSKTLATFGYGAEDILPVLQTIGDAGAALGMDTSGMTMVAQSLGRMKSSDKATREYLDILSDRGIGPYEILADAYNVDQGEIYDMLAKGKIGGRKAVEIILDALSRGIDAGGYAGSMLEQSKSFAGRTSTLEGWQQEMQHAGGAAYNDARKSGIAAQNDYFEGDTGRALEEMNSMIGAGKAFADNLQEQYQREAISALLLGKSTTVFDSDDEETLQAKHAEYEDLLKEWASASDEDKAVLSEKMENLKTEAESLAEGAYNASGMMQDIHDAEIDHLTALRENTAALGEAAWGWTHRLAQEENKGLGGWFTNYVVERGEEVLSERSSGSSGGGAQVYDSGRASGKYGTVPEYGGVGIGGKAFGLDRVPYDGFPAILHEDERVLTAQEARRADRAGGAPAVQVTVTGNTFYGSDEAMEDRVARKVGREVQRAILLAQP